MIAEYGWAFRGRLRGAIFGKLMAGGSPFAGEMVERPIYRGVTTGLNEAFVIDGSTRAKLIQMDTASGAYIKPFIRGEDLRTWYQRRQGSLADWTCQPVGQTHIMGSIWTEHKAWERVQATIPALPNIYCHSLPPHENGWIRVTTGGNSALDYYDDF